MCNGDPSRSKCQGFWLLTGFHAIFLCPPTCKEKVTPGRTKKSVPQASNQNNFKVTYVSVESVGWGWKTMHIKVKENHHTSTVWLCAWLLPDPFTPIVLTSGACMRLLFKCKHKRELQSGVLIGHPLQQCWASQCNLSNYSTLAILLCTLKPHISKQSKAVQQPVRCYHTSTSFEANQWFSLTPTGVWEASLPQLFQL